MFNSIPGFRGLLLLALSFTCINCRQHTSGKEDGDGAHLPDSAENIVKKVADNGEQAQPQLFPFGQELSSFHNSQTLRNEAGDCTTTLREFNRDSLRIVTDSTDCFDYGVHNQYFLFRKDSLEQVHIFEFYPQYDPAGEKLTYVATETVYSLARQPARTYVRSDTLAQPEPGEMKSAFESELIPDRDALLEDLRIQLASLEDPGEDPYGLNIEVYKDTDGGKADIYLYSNAWANPAWISQEPAMSPIPEEQYIAWEIPKAAAFAFNSWYAGGGYIYYGLIEGSEVMIYRRFVEETQPDEERFTLYKMISLDPQASTPSYYICYRDDRDKDRVLMIAISENGIALWAVYKGVEDQYILVEKTRETDTSGAVPLLENSYGAFSGNTLSGTFILTHSGNWDYAKFAPADKAEEQRFTINHEASTGEKGYSTKPCF
ncbi:hypothetical protein [Zeaxanthinibacter enoshimensis]|uniref:Uncharacterized protein n=1 Tax=Zeaxanthinibacter enoshimensis TaxID=392009 RepID=A0A4R6TRB6_9FLAO|nr:hypothetical protein [Zeaxanthinibacter enoshimensis]TDQ33066.1 hypothetical protein CLV82_0904 [Zeaxanthinibacter enoshimensis]